MHPGPTRCVRMRASFEKRGQLFQLVFFLVLGRVTASTSATAVTSRHRTTDCIERAERAEATVRELRDRVQTLHGTVERLSANIRTLVSDTSLKNRLPEASSFPQPRDRRSPNDSSGCRNFTALGVCPTCGGTFAPCVVGTHCSSEINTVCTALQSAFKPTGFEYGWSSLHTYVECAAAVVCIDCSAESSSAIDQVPCPPDGYTGDNTSRVLLLLDNTQHLNFTSSFGGSTAYPRYMAGLSLSNATVNGSQFDLSSMGVGGDVNLSQSTVVNGISTTNFVEASVYGNVDLSRANVSDGISNNSFYRAVVGSNLDLSNADVSGGISNFAFSSVTVSGSIDLSGANVSGGISKYAFSSADVDGNIDLRGADVSGGITEFAFIAATIGNDLDLAGADLSRGGLQPGVFVGATVFGVLNVSGAQFQNNTLPIQMLYGLNVQGLDFSRCNLVSLTTRPCPSESGCRSGLTSASRSINNLFPSILEHVEGGPFTGMSMPVGIESIAVDLSQNLLTQINQWSLLGITATTVNLGGNPDLAVFHPFWFQSVANARVIDTAGNPTRCHRLNVSGALIAAFTLKETATTECQCGSGTAGTGNFCTAQPCNATLKVLNTYAATTLGGARFSVQPGQSAVPSRGNATFECPKGKHPNNATAVQVECLGGAFLLPTNQCVDDTTRRFTSGEIAAIVLGALLPVLATVIYYCVYVRPLQRKRQHLSYTLQDTVKQTEMNERLLEATQGDLEEATAVNTRMRGAWKIAEEDVAIGAVLASGAFGVVHSGTFAGLRVAVKVLKKPLDEELYPDVGREFARECETLMSMRHASLLIFYGAGLTSENRPFMVTEFMSRGSLRAVLLDLEHELGWDVRRKIAVQIARGMEYLHELGIVHRDLKSDNCLLNDQLDAKVCDFGTSRLLTAHRPMLRETSFNGGAGVQDTGAMTATMTKGVGTLLWMAPELLRGGSKYGPKVDVYSYGVIMWELATRKRPWDQIEEQQYIKFFAVLLAALEADERPTIPSSVAELQPHFVALMQRCWGNDPTSRPPFGEVVRVLILSRAAGP